MKKSSRSNRMNEGGVEETAEIIIKKENIARGRSRIRKTGKKKRKMKKKSGRSKRIMRNKKEEKKPQK